MLFCHSFELLGKHAKSKIALKMLKLFFWGLMLASVSGSETHSGDHRVKRKYSKRFFFFKENIYAVYMQQEDINSL